MKQGKREFVAYYRVSTKTQNREMPAQRQAVKNYLKAYWPPSASFTEVESGKESHNRPALKEALTYCKENNATLIVAKLDRLSRDLEFIGWLQKTDIKFVCCDMPQATRETIGFMSVMARWEREQIARRTKEALSIKREKGVLLGSKNPKVRAGLKRYQADCAKRRKQKAEQKKLDKAKQKELREKSKALKLASLVKPPSKMAQADAKIVPFMRLLRKQGFSFKKIAKALNESGHKTRRGVAWCDVKVFTVCKRNNI